MTSWCSLIEISHVTLTTKVKRWINQGSGGTSDLLCNKPWRLNTSNMTFMYWITSQICCRVITPLSILHEGLLHTNLLVLPPPHLADSQWNNSISSINKLSYLSYLHHIWLIHSEITQYQVWISYLIWNSLWTDFLHFIQRYN